MSGAHWTEANNPFTKDTSKFWFKPNISREEAVRILKDKLPGSFVVRESNSFPGAFGLALKVSSLPPGVHQTSPDGVELVRHFLIESNKLGVKLKGCSSEPIFGSLTALVNQHAATPLSLPVKLLLPDEDLGITENETFSPIENMILEEGVSFSVVQLNCVDLESLTGPQAIRKTVDDTLDLVAESSIETFSVTVRAAPSGITVTDNTRQHFFRKFYPASTIKYCGFDPYDRRWLVDSEDNMMRGKPRIFGFVHQKVANSPGDNGCLIFAEVILTSTTLSFVTYVNKHLMKH